MGRPSDARRITRAEVAVVVGLTLFVLGMVPPLFSRSREHQERISCGANLAEIGKAMLIYANDYDGALPRSGGPTTTWGPTVNWTAPARYIAFGLNPVDDSGGTATISSCFYLLVKYMEMPTRTFVCPSDTGTTELKLCELAYIPSGYELWEAWDFGAPFESFRHCSYAYHVPYGVYALTTSRDPNLAVAADRNPWITSPAADPADFSSFIPDVLPWSGTADSARNGNALTHKRDGQNVLFLDGRVRFETRPYCAVDQDNIYTLAAVSDGGNPCGVCPSTCYFSPTSEGDSVLIHDPNAFGSCTEGGSFR